MALITSVGDYSIRVASLCHGLAALRFLPSSHRQLIVGSSQRCYAPLTTYDRPVPARASSFILTAGILLNRRLLVVLDDFAELGEDDEA